MSTTRLLISLMALALIGAGCTPKKTVKKPFKDTDFSDYRSRGPSSEEGLGEDPDVNVQEASIRGKEFAESPDLATVHFDYDMYSLSGKARIDLRENAEYLKAHPDLEILVQGHCDERGTLEYNLALGQKRAKAVRDYYIRIGVPGRAVATISFGEERPLCMEADEDCWARNRRAETRIRSQVSSNGKPNFGEVR